MGLPLSPVGTSGWSSEAMTVKSAEAVPVVKTASSLWVPEERV